MRLTPSQDPSAPPGQRPSQQRRYVGTRTGGDVSTWKTILVGVDGSRGSRKALSWAAAEAAEHGADLVVLRVWEHRLPPPAGNPAVPTEDRSGAGPRAAEELVQIIKEELGDDPPVVAQPVVKHGRAAEILIEQSA